MTESSNRVSQLRQMFDRGWNSAIDPANQEAIAGGGSAKTTLNSSWLHLRCPVCAHTFRLGDEVRLSGDGRVEHAPTPGLCPQDQVDIHGHPEAIAAFFAGLDSAWPPPENIPVVRLVGKHDLLAPPLGGFRRRTCAVCAHTLRPNDLVVICPCSPHQPKCGKAVHRDTIHGLHCLDAWNPRANGQRYCPVTSQELNL